MSYDWLDRLEWLDRKATSSIRLTQLSFDPDLWMGYDEQIPLHGRVIFGSRAEPFCFIRMAEHAQADFAKLRRMARAKRVVDLLTEPKGPTIKEIARREGVSIAALQKDPDIRKLAEEAIARYSLPPDIAREYVRALRLRVASEAAEAGDHETVLKATAQIASDPDVKLSAAFANISIDNGDKILGIEFPKALEGETFDVPALPAAAVEEGENK